MQKAVHNCATGNVDIVEIEGDELAAMQAEHAKAEVPPPVLTLEEKLARVGISLDELKAELAASK